MWLYDSRTMSSTASYSILGILNTGSESSGGTRDGFRVYTPGKANPDESLPRYEKYVHCLTHFTYAPALAWRMCDTLLDLPLRQND